MGIKKERKLIATLPEYVGQNATVAGWVNSIRPMKTMNFVVLRDHTGMAQGTYEKGSGNLDATLESLKPESAVIVKGNVIKNEKVKLGQLEIMMDDVEVVSSPSGHIPINSESNPEARLDWRFLDLRKPKNNLIFRVQTTAEDAMRKYWLGNGFTEIHSPKLMKGASESGSELFQLNYFGETASLAQSPQFYKQMAMAAGLDRVFEIGPVFRANPSFTRRHDTEFTSVDVEISWIDSHEDVMELEENWLQYVLGEVEAKHGAEIKDHFGAKVTVPAVPFPRVTMSEAYAILKKQGYDVDRGPKGDLDPEGEKKLAKYIADQFGHEFVFVTDYPAAARAFYHMRYPGTNTTKSFDLIWKGLEVTTGAQREHRPEILEAQAKEKRVNPDAIKHYLDFFRYGCPPHGGYGFGLTRMLMTMVDAPNVREVTYVYRGPNRLTP